MSRVVAVIVIKAAEGRGDEVVAAFNDALEQTHKEEGCISYAMHRDNANPDTLINIEHWRSQEDLDAHMQQPYIAELMAAAGAPGLLADIPQMYFTTSLGLGDPAKGNL